MGGERPDTEDGNKVTATGRACEKAGSDSRVAGIFRPGTLRAEYWKERTVQSSRSLGTIPICVSDETELI